MCRFVVIRLAALALLAAFTTSALAASADDFKTALAKAAQAAAAAGKYDEAIKDAQQAEALANASIAQAKEQAADWTKAVIR
jgi:hypothetical protein